jgi:HK97 gp10 family phage protein
MAAETVTVTGLRETLASLDILRQMLSARGIKAKNGNPLRAALRQGANVILKQARANVDAIVAIPNVNGRDLSTGSLKRAIKVRRPNRRFWRAQHDEVARVYIDHKTRYPVSRAGTKYNRTNDIGMMLEFGTERRAPMPFMRPAFESTKQKAADTFRAEFEMRVKQLIDRYRRAL